MNMDAEQERRIHNSNVAQSLVPGGATGEPTIYINMGRIPKELVYLQHYALDMIYIAPPGPTETPRHFIRRLCNTIQQMAIA